MPSRAALELLLQLKDEATTAAAKVEGGLVGAAGAYDKATAANDRLVLAQLKAEQAAQRLADAQANLARNTDPEREEKLATEVAKAAVAFDNAAENAQRAAAAVEHAGQEADQSKSIWSGVESGMTKLNSTIGVAKELWQGLQEVYGATVGAAIDYSEKVEDLARTAGISAEEASKMLEANRALKLSYEDTQQAAEMAAKRGVRLNAEEMAKLADRYVALEDPVKRAQMLVEVFGKSGLKTAEAMSQGGAAFRAAGEEAAALGHTMDAETVESLQRVQAEIESLKRAGEWVAIKVGITLVDAAETASKIGGLITGAPFREALQQHIDVLNQTTGPYETYIAEVRRAAGAIGLQVDAQGNLVRVMKDAYGTTHTEMVEASAALTQAQWDAVQSSQALRGEQEQYGYLLEDMTVTYGRVTDATGEFGDAAEELWSSRSLAYAAEEAAEAMTVLRAGMSGAISNEMESFKNKQEELKAKSAELQEKISELEGKRYLTPEQRQQLEDLRTQLSDNGQALLDNAAAHEEATKRILFDILQQQMAADGLSTQESIALVNIATQWGLVDQASSDATQKIIGWIADAQASGNWDLLQQRINDLQASINGLTGKDIAINVSLKRRWGGAVEEDEDVPGSATGTYYAPGGRRLVGENGPEIVELPAGSRVYSHAESERMGSPAGGINVSIPGMQVNGDLDVEEFAYRVAQRIAELTQ